MSSEFQSPITIKIPIEVDIQGEDQVRDAMGNLQKSRGTKGGKDASPQGTREKLVDMFKQDMGLGKGTQAYNFLVNPKAGITSLEVLIGVVISIIIYVSAATIISNFYRLSDSSKDSFNQLVALIEKVNKDDHGTIQSMSLRMDDGTVIIGFTKDDEDFHFRDKYIGTQDIDSVNSL